jgi:D-3-phosphoglycerate dehydrogenase
MLLQPHRPLPRQRTGLGRRDAGGEAVVLLSLDEAVTAELLATVKALPGVKTAMALKF